MNTYARRVVQLADRFVIDLLFQAKRANRSCSRTFIRILEGLFDLIRNDRIMSPNVPHKFPR